MPHEHLEAPGPREKRDQIRVAMDLSVALREERKLDPL